jgi:hypothetical protein
MLDHVPLETAKAVVAEDFLEQGAGSIHRRSVTKRGSGTMRASFWPDDPESP